MAGVCDRDSDSVQAARSEGLDPRRQKAAFSINADEVLNMVEGDVELLVSLIDIFLGELDALVSAVREAVAQQDASAIQFASHKLKGSARVFGDNPVTDACLALEVMGRNRELANAKPALQRVHAAVEEFAPALHRLRDSLDPAGAPQS